MSGHTIALVALLLVLALLVVVGLAVSRYRSLTHRVGSFRCSARVRGRFRRGIAHYGSRHLYWWRLRSLSPRPLHVWPRGAFEVLGRTPVDAAAPPGGPYLVRCRIGDDEEIELVMSPEAYAGLTSWLEAAPPVARTVI